MSSKTTYRPDFVRDILSTVTVELDVKLPVCSNPIWPLPEDVIRYAVWFDLSMTCRLLHTDVVASEQIVTSRWRHNWHDCVSNHQAPHCLLNRLFGCRSKNTSQLRVTGLCAGNSPETGEFPAQMSSNAENASISWRHHELLMVDLDTLLSIC